MPTDILISSDPWENRVAILEDGDLAEIYFEREEKIIGSIYKGKVQNVLPGMGASFVDIGLGRNAFLYVDDINKTPLNIGDVEITQGRSGWTITEKVNRGDDVLVQIVKEPRGLKGARISTNISLPGRYLILMPQGKYSGVSRKIESADERTRLKKIMQRIRPEGMATVVRTAAGGVSDAELMADLGVLIRMWHGIVEQFKHAQSPALLHKDMNLVFKAARDFITPEVQHVYIDDAEEAERVRDFMRLLGPQYVERIQPYKGGRKLFADYHIDDELTKLLRPTVKLPSGGSIVIESTEALTVIDVNSGKFTGGRNLEDTIVRTNIEAAAEIGRQVRLRDIGGIIVCDFIDMNTEASRSKVIATLEGVLRKDRTRTTIQSFSPLGLLEFTRKRVGKDLAQQLRGACPTCSGIGSVLSPESVTISTFRKMRDELTGKNGETPKHVHLHASPTVAASVEFWYEDELKALESQLHTEIDVRVDPAVHPEKPRMTFDNGAHPEANADETPIRVGDEVVVDVLHARLPISSNALAVVHGRLVEIENGANLVGQTIKIKIIDVDGKDILAEAGASFGMAGAEPRQQKRRRRGGRGRSKPISLEEQTEELQELADEAAKGQSVRAAIGISTTAEVEAEDQLVKATGPARAAAVIGDVEADIESADESETGPRKKRRRRRRRRGGVGGDAVGTTQETALNGTAANADDAEGDEDEEGDDEDAVADGTTEGGAQPLAADGLPRKKRRRRRRRGRGGDRGEGSQQPDGTTPSGVPERGIFRVGADGRAEHTGETAPKEPSRALDHRGRGRSGPPAVEPPPPSLSAPDETAQPTRPSRRRRNGPLSAASAPGTLSAPEPMAALPSPTPEEPEAEASPNATPPTPAPTRGRRPRRGSSIAEAEAPVAEAPVAEAPEPEAVVQELPLVAEAKPARRGGRTRTTTAEPVTAAPVVQPEPEPEPEPEAAPVKARTTRKAAAAPAPAARGTKKAPAAPKAPVKATRTRVAAAPAPAPKPAAKAPAARKKAAPAAAAPAAKKSSAPAKKTAAKKTATAAKKSTSRKKS